jgi:5S rRNA maturation endonuclease (ribonuclease M5)
MTTTTRLSSTSNRFRLANAREQARLNALTEVASYRLEELLGELGVDLRLRGKMWVGPCPIHGGNNASALTLYPDGHTTRGNWKCRTQGCHQVFHCTLLGFVWGVLSFQNGWRRREDSRCQVAFKEAVWWVCRFLGVKLNEVQADIALAQRKQFVAEMATLGRYPEQLVEGWELEQVRSRLVLPSPYYLARGYSAAILDRYSVGDCRSENPADKFYARTVVPVLDRQGRRVIGATARTHHPECAHCKRWHAADAPCPEGRDDLRRPVYAKWRHTDGLCVEDTLYNWWSAADPIRRQGAVVLVEGPGDVWRLEEAGVRNAVALFGKSLEDPQQVLLESSGALDVVLLLDQDKAGRTGVADIKERLERTFRMRIPEVAAKDVGDMTAEQVRTQVVPLLSRPTKEIPT